MSPNPIVSIVRKKFDILQKFPRDREFVLDEVPNIHGRDARVLQSEGILRVTGIEHTPRRRRRYRLTAEAKRALDTYEPEFLMPCGHRGFVNVDGDRFMCSFKECNEIHSRCEVKRAIDRGSESDDEVTEVTA